MLFGDTNEQIGDVDQEQQFKSRYVVGSIPSWESFNVW